MTQNEFNELTPQKKKIFANPGKEEFKNKLKGTGNKIIQNVKNIGQASDKIIGTNFANLLNFLSDEIHKYFNIKEIEGMITSGKETGIIDYLTQRYKAGYYDQAYIIRSNNSINPELLYLSYIIPMTIEMKAPEDETMYIIDDKGFDFNETKKILRQYIPGQGVLWQNNYTSDFKINKGNELYSWVNEAGLENTSSSQFQDFMFNKIWKYVNKNTSKFLDIQNSSFWYQNVENFMRSLIPEKDRIKENVQKFDVKETKNNLLIAMYNKNVTKDVYNKIKNLTDIKFKELINKIRGV